MVVENEVSCVVGIVELEYLGYKCAKYWPRTKEKKKFKNIEIKVLEKQSNSLYEHKRLMVRTSEKTREVEHFYLYQWEDRKTPSDQVLSLFI